MSGSGRPAIGSGRFRWGAAEVALAILAVVAVLSPWMAPHNPNQIDLAHTLAPISSAHWLGTDADGRDILSRLLVATRLSVGTGLAIAVLATGLGCVVGMAAGFWEGWVDGVLRWCTDALLAFPSLLLQILLAAIWPHGDIWSLTLIIGLTNWAPTARMIRAEVIRLRSAPFIEAAQSLGASPVRVLTSHLAPHLTGLLAALWLRAFAGAIYLISALSFLGMGPLPPAADWGTLLAEANAVIWTHPLAAVWPGLGILWAVWAADGTARHLVESGAPPLIWAGIGDWRLSRRARIDLP